MKPYLGQTVLFKNESGVLSPAIVTQINPDGSVSLFDLPVSGHAAARHKVWPGSGPKQFSALVVPVEVPAEAAA